MQETDFKVKNTFDKKYYFSSNFGFTQMQIYCFSLMDAQIWFRQNTTTFLKMTLIIFMLSFFVLCIHFDDSMSHWCFGNTQLYNDSLKMSFRFLGKSLMALLLLEKLWNVGYSIASTVNYDSLSTSDFASLGNSNGNFSLLDLKVWAQTSLNSSCIH